VKLGDLLADVSEGGRGHRRLHLPLGQMAIEHRTDDSDQLVLDLGHVILRCRANVDRGQHATATGHNTNDIGLPTYSNISETYKLPIPTGRRAAIFRLFGFFVSLLSLSSTCPIDTRRKLRCPRRASQSKETNRKISLRNFIDKHQKQTLCFWFASHCQPIFPVTGRWRWNKHHKQKQRRKCPPRFLPETALAVTKTSKSTDRGSHLVILGHVIEMTQDGAVLVRQGGLAADVGAAIPGLQGPVLHQLGLEVRADRGQAVEDELHEARSGV